MPVTMSETPTYLPPHIFLYGLAGAGKSYCGQLFARRLGYHYYDLDVHLTPAMQEAIRAKTTFTDAMRDEFFEVIREKIREACGTHAKILFAQGAYKERHRAFLKAALPSLHFVCVSAPIDVLQGRLAARGGQVTADYALSIAKGFEPGSEVRLLLNEGAEDAVLVERFEQLFKKS